jgi:multiple sugar transport system permease protein
MKNQTFISFVGPSLFLMALFIAGPLLSVAWQSLHVTQPVYIQVETEVCTPGFLSQKCTTENQTQPQLGLDGKIITETKFVGFESYQALLKPELFLKHFSQKEWSGLANIDFYKALRFTLTFTLITLPIVLILGLLIALSVNQALQSLRGPIIFISLLPFVITPVIGALSIRWLFVGDGILTTLLELLLKREISIFAQGWTIEILMLGYRVWHVAPFAFIVFYAGLQTVNRDTLESAIVDGASRWQRLQLVILPHISPLVLFVSIIHLMDSYRVFEEVIGFRSEAHVISLQWLTYDLLTPDDTGNRLISRASASSMLTMIGIIFLLIFPLYRSWREHKHRRTV